MRNSIFLCLYRYRLILLSLLLVASSSFAPWGFWAHKRINRLAVFTLPSEIIPFYKSHIEYVTEHAIDPDKRRYAVADEAAKHYIDIDHYCSFPHDCVPQKWNDAVASFSEDTLKIYGIGPWHVQWMYYDLIEAFKEQEINRILKVSADIGHYVSDGHVPLHTTTNYNGQLTGQEGIHAFWESRVPELFGDDYDYFVGPAILIDDISTFIWDYVYESSAAVDSVLLFEQQLSQEMESDLKYTFEDRNKLTVRNYSQDFSAAYQLKLDGMIEKRLRASVIAVGSIWYSAWVEAGQPNLTDITNVKEYSETDSLLLLNKQGIIKGRNHWE